MAMAATEGRADKSQGLQFIQTPERALGASSFLQRLCKPLSEYPDILEVADRLFASVGTLNSFGGLL